MLLAFPIYSQAKAQDTSDRLKKGRALIKAAQKVIYKRIKKSDIKGFELVKEITLATGKQKQSLVKPADMERMVIEKK